MATPTNLANQVKVGHALDPITQCQIAQTFESAPKQCSVIANIEDKWPTFEMALRGLSCCICVSVCSKVPTDHVKISVNEAMHMGFNIIPTTWVILPYHTHCNEVRCNIVDLASPFVCLFLLVTPHFHSWQILSILPSVIISMGGYIMPNTFDITVYPCQNGKYLNSLCYKCRTFVSEFVTKLL